MIFEELDDVNTFAFDGYDNSKLKKMASSKKKREKQKLPSKDEKRYWFIKHWRTSIQ